MLSKALKADSSEEREKWINTIINRLADALLVNSVSENFNEHYLSIEAHQALSKSVSSIKNIIAPSDSLNFRRAKEGFIFMIKNLVQQTSENIPETTVSFEDLIRDIENLPADLQSKNYTHENVVSPLKQAHHQEENWGEEAESKEEEEEHDHDVVHE